MAEDAPYRYLSRVGPAIVGATLLLRGDTVFVQLQPAGGEEPISADGRSQRLELPQPRLGAAKAGAGRQRGEGEYDFSALIISPVDAGGAKPETPVSATREERGIHSARAPPDRALPADPAPAMAVAPGAGETPETSALLQPDAPASGIDTGAQPAAALAVLDFPEPALGPLTAPSLDFKQPAAEGPGSEAPAVEMPPEPASLASSVADGEVSPFVQLRLPPTPEFVGFGEKEEFEDSAQLPAPAAQPEAFVAPSPPAATAQATTGGGLAPSPALQDLLDAGHSGEPDRLALLEPAFGQSRADAPEVQAPLPEKLVSVPADASAYSSAPANRVPAPPADAEAGLASGDAGKDELNPAGPSGPALANMAIGDPAAVALPEPAFGRSGAGGNGLTDDAAAQRMAEGGPQRPPPDFHSFEVEAEEFPGESRAAPVAAQPETRLAIAETPRPPPAPASRAAMVTGGGFPVPAIGGAGARPGQAQEIAQPDSPAGLVPFTRAEPMLPAPDKAGYTDTSPRPASSPAPSFSYDDELILEIRTEKGLTSDTVIAYGSRAGVYLPLGALARLLDLAIVVSDDGHYASGWYLSEDRQLRLDLRQWTLFAGGREGPLSRSDAVAFEGEMFLREDFYANLLPLTMTVNLRAQAITVATLEPFPFEERLARETERRKLESRGGRSEVERWPREETPWRAFTVPSSDVELRAASDDDNGTRLEGDLRIAGDLAFMTAQAYLSADTKDGLTAARLELGRRDPDADLLGPLRATEFQIGDVYVPTMEMGLRGTSGRGFYVTNAPLERASIFEKVDLRGELENGFEVELYRNNILIGSTRNPVNGQYEFLQVPVDYGLNVFRLVFYGPQGQRREETRRYSVGDGRLAKGQFVYTLGAAQKGTNLFDVRPPDFSVPQDFRSWRTSAEIEYGISSAVTASLGGAWFETGGDKRWLVNGSLRSGIGGMAARLVFSAQNGGATAVGVGLGGKLLGTSFTLSHAEYSGGAIDEVRAFTSEPARRATELNLNGTLRLGGSSGGLAVPFNGRMRRIEFADGRGQLDASLRGSARAGGMLLSSSVEYSRTTATAGIANSQLTGTFDLAKLPGSRTQYRASVGYRISPDAKITSVGAEVDHAIDDRTLASAIIGHDFTGDQTRLGISAIRRFDRFSLGLEGNYGIQDKDYSIMLRLGFSLGRNPVSRNFFIAKPGLATGGAAAVRTFLDRDGNGEFGEKDEPLRDVRFVSGTSHATSDAEGLAFLGGLGDGSRSSFVVDQASLPDIMMAPATKGVEIVPRPGRIHVSEFAVQAMSEIEGDAFFESDGRKRAVSGLSLELVNEAGEVAARSRSEVDGFFLFEQVPPGRYAIRVEPGQSSRLKIRLKRAPEVTVGAESDVYSETLVVEQYEAVQ